MGKQILFVCTGNTCRSPFAELMMKKLLEEKYGETGRDADVSSAGTYAFSEVKPPVDALRAGKRFGIDLSEHGSRLLSLSMMESSGMVFCMTARHKAYLVAKYPWFEDRIFVLKKYAEGLHSDKDSDLGDESYDITDPIGQGVEVYLRVYDEIKTSLEKIIEKWEEEDNLRTRIASTFKFAVASDHAGFHLKTEMIGFLKEMGHEIVDFGSKEGEGSVDYPDYAKLVAKHVAEGKADFGLLVCGTGVGMSIAANRTPGIRAVATQDVITARISRSHNNTNVLCLGERTTTAMVAREIVQTWLSTPFEFGRHERRVKKMDESPE